MSITFSTKFQFFGTFGAPSLSQRVKIFPKSHKGLRILSRFNKNGAK